MKFINWLRRMLSEGNGAPSFARTATFIMLIGSVFWVTFIVVKTHALPSRLLDLTTLFASLYGINKFSSKTDKGSIDTK
jgi:hypothetical protein